jgi:hypothetical protein
VATQPRGSDRKPAGQRGRGEAGAFYGRWLPTLVVGEGLRKQGFLGRIVDIGAELFAMSAVCVRAHDDPAAGLTGELSGQEAGTAAELASAFCVQARSRAEELFRQLWRNTDSDDVRLARGVLSGRYTWLEEGIIVRRTRTKPRS